MKTIHLFFIFSLFCSMSLWAQSVGIYRGGSFVKTISAFPQIENAVGEALAGDSLVLSVGLFRERRVRIDKDLIIQGTQTARDSTIIEQGGARRSIFYVSGSSTAITKVVFRDIIVQNAYLFISGTTDTRLDSLYGAGIKAFEYTDLSICGHSIFRYCGISTRILTPYSTIRDTGMIGGSAIYTRGKLLITGHCKFYGNYAEAVYGGAICSVNELVLEGDVLLDSNFGGGGGAIAVQGKAIIKGNVQISHNFSGVGGGLYSQYADMEISDSVRIVGNEISAHWSGGLYAFHSNVLLQNKTLIGANNGGGMALFASSLVMLDSTLITSNVGVDNYAAGIYNKGSSIEIRGGQIVHNRLYYDTVLGKGVAIYNDTLEGSPAPVIKIANTRIYNPTRTFKRSSEIYNAEGVRFSSDSTWWGQSDTTGLIVSEDSTNMDSWIIAHWSLNKGVAIGSATSFPIDAYFTLNTAAPIWPSMFWMLLGVYQCDSGSFSPDTAYMLSTNYISTVYTAAYSTRIADLFASVDADTFVNTLRVTGLGLHNVSMSKDLKLSIYPNPSKGTFTITSLQGGGSKALNSRIYDLLGRVVHQQSLSISKHPSSIQFDAADGIYLLEISDEAAAIYRERIEVRH